MLATTGGRPRSPICSKPRALAQVSGSAAARASAPASLMARSPVKPPAAVVQEAVVLTASQEAYLDWLVDPQRVGSKQDQAEKFGVAPSTVYRWEQAPHFRKAWSDRVQELGGDPDRVQKVYDTLYAKALEGDTRSAELWLKAIGKLNQTQEVVHRKSARDLTNDELDALIAEQATTAKLRNLKAVP